MTDDATADTDPSDLTPVECPRPQHGVKMRTVILPPGSKGIDTILKLDRDTCARLRDAGVVFVVRYLASLSKEEMETILLSGLALSVVTYANSFDPSDEIAQLRALGLPQNATVWLDVEKTKDPLPEKKDLLGRISFWAHALKASGYEPGLYVGAGLQLTSAELFGLPITRYWHSCSRVVDGTGNEAAPACGWTMWQCSPPNITVAGVTVDADFVQADYGGRQVAFVAA